jgi:hypothetical protein
MQPLLDLLTRFALALLLALGLLALGPALAWCATNQLGPAIVAVAIVAQAQRPPPLAALPAGPPTLDLLASLPDRALLAWLLATEVR